METLRDLDLVRAVAPSRNAALLRAAAEGAMPTMEVRFSQFNTWYEIASWWEGDFMERTVRGAFSKTIQEQGDRVKVQFDHGYDYRVGSVLLGVPEELYEATDSPVGVVPLFDTSYNRDLLPGLQARAYGSSFRFRVIRDEWNDDPGTSEHNPKGLPERTITEIRLMEFGPVVWPANPDATAGLRSMTDDFYARMRSQDPHRVEALEARAAQLRTPGRPGAAPLAERTPDPGAAAPDTDDAPAPGHPSGLSSAARSRVLAAPFLA